MDSIFAQTHNYKNSEDSMGVNRLTSPLGTQKFMLIFFDKTVGPYMPVGLNIHNLHNLLLRHWTAD